jgi:hypothetical protein
MTRLGKGFVFASLAFSMMAAVWAYGLYSDRTDWKAELKRLDEQIAERAGALQSAAAGWGQSRAELEALEARRPPHRQWYEAQLAALRSAGKGQAIQAPAEARGGVPELDDQGLPRMAAVTDRANKPLLSLAGYDDEERDTLKAIEQENKRLGDLVRQDEALTNLLVGEPPEGKGLHERIREERERIAGVLEEQKLTEPLLVNAAAERDVVTRRARALQARVDELKKTEVARGGGGR